MINWTDMLMAKYTDPTLAKSWERARCCTSISCPQAYPMPDPPLVLALTTLWRHRLFGGHTTPFALIRFNHLPASIVAVDGDGLQSVRDFRRKVQAEAVKFLTGESDRSVAGAAARLEAPLRDVCEVAWACNYRIHKDDGPLRNDHDRIIPRTTEAFQRVTPKDIENAAPDYYFMSAITSEKADPDFPVRMFGSVLVHMDEKDEARRELLAQIGYKKAEARRMTVFHTHCHMLEIFRGLLRPKSHEDGGPILYGQEEAHVA